MNVWTIGEWVGKVGMLLVFITSGIAHLTSTKSLAGYAQSKRIPKPAAAVVLTGLMMLVGSVMIIFRWHAIWGSGLILTFVWLAAFLIHDYWNETDAMARGNQQAHFWKNVALGSAAILYAVGVHRGAW